MQDMNFKTRDRQIAKDTFSRFHEYRTIGNLSTPKESEPTCVTFFLYTHALFRSLSIPLLARSRKGESLHRERRGRKLGPQVD